MLLCPSAQAVSVAITSEAMSTQRLGELPQEQQPLSRRGHTPLMGSLPTLGTLVLSFCIRVGHKVGVRPKELPIDANEATPRQGPRNTRVRRSCCLLGWSIHANLNGSCPWPTMEIDMKRVSYRTGGRKKSLRKGRSDPGRALTRVLAASSSFTVADTVTSTRSLAYIPVKGTASTST